MRERARALFAGEGVIRAATDLQRGEPGPWTPRACITDPILVDEHPAAAEADPGDRRLPWHPTAPLPQTFASHER